MLFRSSPAFNLENTICGLNKKASLRTGKNDTKTLVQMEIFSYIFGI